MEKSSRHYLKRSGAISLYDRELSLKTGAQEKQVVRIVCSDVSGTVRPMRGDGE